MSEGIPEDQIPDLSYGACLIGPPGSGKTSAIKALKEMCEKLKRHVIVMNLDPANDKLPYEADFDICTTINVKSIMESQDLGPNGGLIYCMESVAANVNEIIEAVRPRVEKASYFLIDFPGQVELYTHSECVRQFLDAFQKELKIKLATVNFVDVVLTSTKQGYLGQSLMSLGMMLRLYTPHINVLSKFDLVQTKEVDLPFDTETCDFEDMVSSGVPSKLHQKIVELLCDYDLVSYEYFSVMDESSIIHLIEIIDKAVGCNWML